MSKAVFWFSNDLRLSDNLALTRAIEQEPELAFVYCLDPEWLRPNKFNCKALGKFRHRFLVEALRDLDSQLQAFGQHLMVYFKAPRKVLAELYNNHNVQRVYHSHNAGLNEQRFFSAINEHTHDLSNIATHTHTLYEPQELPFDINELPATFSKFRRVIEKVKPIIKRPVAKPTKFPKPFIQQFNWLSVLEQPNAGSDPRFSGGEIEGLKHVAEYFSNDSAQTYKQTRNALDTWQHSTKFSPWLALGNVSSRQIIEQLRQHEKQMGANESTYWIEFELLWREYFQWYAHAHKEKLFSFTGINKKSPFTSFYGERFQRWCQGNTPYPIVNACMKQLNATGYMSNRGRQLVASCFVHELKLDWRYGASYFEQQLIDYDVASNWGNWQYLAGVGADPRGSRQFNLDKQTKTYDPEGEFVNAWNGHTDDQTIDSVDAADWPVLPSTNEPE